MGKNDNFYLVTSFDVAAYTQKGTIEMNNKIKISLGQSFSNLVANPVPRNGNTIFKSALYLHISIKVLLIIFAAPLSWCYAQGYISPFKYKDGQFILKNKEEIVNEASRQSSNSKLNLSREFDKSSKKLIREDGEIWLKGYCRYRPPSYTAISKFDETTTEYLFQLEKFPSDTIILSDDFKENGTIPWSDNLSKSDEIENFNALLGRISKQNNDGIPYRMYDSLSNKSSFFKLSYKGKQTGREFEFSRAVSIWVKRINGPKKMPITILAEFAFVWDSDMLSMEINDKGNFTILAAYSNGDPSRQEVADGKSHAWKTGDWNEIAIKKDEFNNILVYTNNELILNLKTPNLPIATRFSSFQLEMPYKWEEEGLQYNIGRITSISYPKLK